MVKSNFRYTALDAFVDKSGPICYGILKPGENYPGGIPVIKVKNIIGGRVLESDLLHTSPEIHKQYKRAEIKSGDLLLTIRGTTGRVAFVPKSLDGANITQDSARIRVSSNDSPRYVYYALQSPDIQRQIELNTVGQAVKGINIGEVKKLTIYHPELQEQQKIALVLSTWDQAITTTEELLKNSQRQKKALQQLLLSGNQRVHGVQSEWQNIRLEQLFSRVTTKNTEASTNVVTISAQHGLIRQEDFFNKTVASETLDNYFLLKKGQFAYNKSYSNGYPMGAIKRLNKYDKGVVTTLYICFEVSDETICNPEFFEHYFESGLLNNGLSKVANEGGRAHGLLNVKPSDFFGLTVFVPEVDEQKAIAAVLTTADQDIHALQAKLACLKQEKKALMQQLFIGKRRVKVDELEVA
ncbi:restriction endonuclease subunit S [Pseudomonas mandelii]|uniref:Type I restriction enzyme, S subunit n=1 Tax=Pseudomonas mandelii TaxID=75612 RepID=A0ABY0VEW5_9PSED|nr:restriction endonuclease subunit S [Pseudomonas mandelii]TWS06700.1 restriction endonuclease subunit S [Pseudomonas mandelii]SDU15932.1 type I restriction enzyme, S subunit [Pseudomonas mandelii]